MSALSLLHGLIAMNCFIVILTAVAGMVPTLYYFRDLLSLIFYQSN